MIARLVKYGAMALCLGLLALLPLSTAQGAITLTEQQEAAKLTPCDAPVNEFGFSISLDGNTALVSAPIDSSIGSACVYVKGPSGAWSVQDELTADPPSDDDRFAMGWSVSLDGDTAVVGANADDVDEKADSGSAYVFTRSGTTWTQQQKLTASDGEAGDGFGLSVSVDGDTIVVGAYLDGSAYVFTRKGTTWTEQQKLTASGGGAGDGFGWSVAVDGKTAVVGAPFDAAGGFAYVYTRKGTAWPQQAKLTANDSIGWSVAVDGDTVVAGSPERNAGGAYVFVRDHSGDWTEPVQLTASDSIPQDRLGNTVSLDGDTALLGAYVEVGENPGPGYAYVFTRSKTGWKQGAKLIPSVDTPYTFFGNGVAVHGKTAMVGAPTSASDGMDGSVYVYDLDDHLKDE